VAFDYASSATVNRTASIDKRDIGGRAGSLRTRLRGEATRWGAAQWLAEVLFVVPLVGAVAIVLARADKGLYRFLTDEDSVLEWWQFFGFLAAAVERANGPSSASRSASRSSRSSSGGAWALVANVS
jgi:hypothetical protein